jgi:hypothetical protein
MFIAFFIESIAKELQRSAIFFLDRYICHPNGVCKMDLRISINITSLWDLECHKLV